ncbi:MAG: hypothetical protein ACHQM6_05965 [Candidatus Kapaibacterium sp.]
MKPLIFPVLLSFVLITGCAKKEDPSQNKYPQIFKQNALELLLHTKTLADGRTVFQLEKNVFLKNKQEQHLIVSSDTLPDLGTEMVTTSDEEEEETPAHQMTKKQYDVLFKVDSLKY